MLNKCYSHDRSGDRGTHTVTALPGACYHPWPACTPQKSVLRRLWRSKYSLQTQGHTWRLRRPSSAWKGSPQIYVKYASAHSEGLTTVGQLQKSRCDLFQQSWGREERIYYQNCNGHRHFWWNSWTKTYQTVEAWTYLKKSNHCQKPKIKFFADLTLKWRMIRTSWQNRIHLKNSLIFFSPPHKHWASVSHSLEHLQAVAQRDKHPSPDDSWWWHMPCKTWKNYVY